MNTENSTHTIDQTANAEGLTTDQVYKYAQDLSVLFRQERQARQQLSERQKDLELLVELYSAMSRCLDVDSLAEVVLEAFVSQLNVSRALMYLRSPDQSGNINYLAGRSLDAAAMPVDPPDVTENQTLYARIVDETLSQMVIDADDGELFSWIDDTYPEGMRPQQVLCLPLLGRQRVLGFLAADLDNRLRSERRTILTLVARQAGVVLETVMLYQQSQSELSVVKELLDTEQKKLIESHQFDKLIGSSSQMKAVFNLLRTVADVNVPVLVTGETGTGKDLVARALHYTSKRKAKPFVSVNCAALPSELVESELFGHEKGSFTGAVQQRRGKVEMAEGGTLFLDEIAEMPANLQAKLLRFLQERTYERVGGTRSMRANVRIVAATNQDIEEAIKDGRLRMDLVYRLNTITVALPALRERLNDVPLLANNFASQANEKFGCTIQGLSKEVIALLMRHSWPGNVRELRNVMDRAAILTHSGTIEPSAIHLAAQTPGTPQLSSGMPMASFVEPDPEKTFTQVKQEIVEQFERSYIDKLLTQTGGNISQAARNAHIDKKNFIEKMRKYELTREDYLE